MRKRAMNIQHATACNAYDERLLPPATRQRTDNESTNKQHYAKYKQLSKRIRPTRGRVCLIR